MLQMMKYSRTMGNSSGSFVKVNVFIDKKKKKVMFAEAQEDFVEIIFSYMTLPLGRIAGVSINNRTGSEDIKLGSLTSLYQSVLKLRSRHFSIRHNKFSLIYPTNPSSSTLCQKLKVNLFYYYPYNDSRHGNYNPVLLNNKGSFLITDDLQVIPYSLDQSILLLKALDVECFDLLEKRTMCFGFREFFDLLKWSLLTDCPLTNLVLGGRSKPKLQLCVPNSKLGSNSMAQPQMIKLLVQKSTKKVICAQVHNFFVEMLFSFLTIPLGAVKHLTMDTSYPLGIDNVYNSISSLGDARYLKSEDVKIMLLHPKVSSSYRRITDFLPIYDRDACRGSSLKKEESFIVSDDLKISLLPSISEIPKLTLGIPVGDIEVMDLSFGEQEALLILKASLTSTSALTDFLNTLM